MEKEFLPSLQQRTKWTRSRSNLSIDDIVVIKDESVLRSFWQLARVSAVYPSPYDQVHKVQVALVEGCLDDTGKRVPSARYFERPVQKLVLLLSAKTD